MWSNGLLSVNKAVRSDDLIEVTGIPNYLCQKCDRLNSWPIDTFALCPKCDPQGEYNIYDKTYEDWKDN